MAELVKIQKNSCIATVPKGSLAAWQKKGWKPVETPEKEPAKPAAKPTK